MKEEFEGAIDFVPTKLDEHGLILNPTKSTYAGVVGLSTSTESVTTPERLRALREMPAPTTAAELQQFLCGSNWMRTGLVDYSRGYSPLQERLDEALSETRKTKRAAAGMKEQRLKPLKRLLGNSAMLTYPDPSKQLIQFSEASDRGGGI
ncbi:Hypothetical protein PHPALM_36941 [Phytophthora palmivora]|uniref:Reverse transcriptase n=1 Tax=Phytophthora palmivora TaxID=4796 RepID=A0A2P4WYN7_9STRA|nr:Hypothetical protein PHPALM_36941 [Phytophthora palmivora]